MTLSGLRMLTIIDLIFGRVLSFRNIVSGFIIVVSIFGFYVTYCMMMIPSSDIVTNMIRMIAFPIGILTSAIAMTFGILLLFDE